MIPRSPDSAGPFVLVSGNTGSGKSTAVRALSEGCALRPYPEALERNSFFASLLRTPKEFAFRGQLAFTVLALETHAAISRDPSPAVQERGLHEVHAIFNTAHHASGDISDGEFALLNTIVGAADMLFAAPALLVHLDAPVDELVRRVRGRGRPGEGPVDSRYLERMDAYYQPFVRSWSASPALRFDTVRHDLRHESGRAELVARVSHALRGWGNHDPREDA
jgi:deoxyadenosine/deoxycytidine kinase